MSNMYGNEIKNIPMVNISLFYDCYMILDENCKTP